MHQRVPVVNNPPCCHSDGDDLSVHGAAEGVVPHRLAHMLHHARVRAAGDDPGT